MIDSPATVIGRNNNYFEIKNSFRHLVTYSRTEEAEYLNFKIMEIIFFKKQASGYFG